MITELKATLFRMNEELNMLIKLYKRTKEQQQRMAYLIELIENTRKLIKDAECNTCGK